MKQLTVKSVNTKSTAGTIEFTCTLLYGNLRAALCCKTATCNEVSVEFLSDPLRSLVIEHIIRVHSIDKAKAGAPDPIAILNDWILNAAKSEMVTQQNDKLSEKQTLFRLKGDKPDQFRSISEQYSDEACQRLHTEYSSRLEEIYTPRKHR